MGNTATSFDPNELKWQGITLTPAAATQIRHLVQQQPGIIGLRLGVKTSGCAGYAYTIATVSEPAPDDLCYEVDGAKLFVAPKSMPLVDGTEVDFVREGLNQIFKFHNPNAQNECGCGESFGVQG
ncbi:(Fe-S)-cluster assembly protein [Salmonella enterica subsp. enterica serovar Choleraesuis]|nr:(Fe-S)-cluster assembly protein [Salmonella enterica subsp. enterica serovar Choleraesuis]